MRGSFLFWISVASHFATENKRENIFNSWIHMKTETNANYIQHTQWKVAQSCVCCECLLYVCVLCIWSSATYFHVLPTILRQSEWPFFLCKTNIKYDGKIIWLDGKCWSCTLTKRISILWESVIKCIWSFVLSLSATHLFRLSVSVCVYDCRRMHVEFIVVKRFAHKI